LCSSLSGHTARASSRHGVKSAALAGEQAKAHKSMTVFGLREHNGTTRLLEKP
jgi:hypothetical protein